MTNLRIRAATDGDRELLVGLLAGLSVESAYRRFLTGFAGRPGPTLLSRLFPDGRCGGAVLGFVDDELAAHGLWVAIGEGRAAELAVVVADRHQRQGIGTALAYALTAELSARGIEQAQVVSSIGNQAVARMVARQAPTARYELDGTLATYSFPTPSTVLRPSPRVVAHHHESLRRTA